MVDQAKQAQANAEQKLKHSNQTVNKKLCRAIPAVTSINNVCDGRGVLLLERLSRQGVGA
jgi:hypothetical protein